VADYVSTTDPKSPATRPDRIKRKLITDQQMPQMPQKRPKQHTSSHRESQICQDAVSSGANIVRDINAHFPSGVSCPRYGMHRLNPDNVSDEKSQLSQSGHIVVHDPRYHTPQYRGSDVYDCARCTDLLPTPCRQISTQILISDTAQVISYAIEGEIKGLRRLFDQGNASPFDVSASRNFSLIRVRVITNLLNWFIKYTEEAGSGRYTAA
jgi:hypothetical protein